MKQGRWQEAYPLLLEAWQNKHHWQIALNLARTEVELGKYRDALEHLAFVHAATDVPPNDLKEVTSLEERADAKVGRLRIDASPPGAEVFIDGTLAGSVPVTAPLTVDPGLHNVELRLGERRETHRVEVKSGKITDVTLLLRSVDADTSATIKQKSSQSGMPLSADQDPAIRTAVLAAGTGLTFAGLVLGGVALGVSVDQGAQASRYKQTASGSHSINQAQYQNVAFWSFVGAAAFGGATIAYHFVSMPAAATHVTAGVTAGPDRVGVSVLGTF